MVYKINTHVALLVAIVLFSFALGLTPAHAITNTNSIDLESSSSQYLSISDGNQSGLDLSGSSDATFEWWQKLESCDAFTVIAKVDSNDGYRIEYGGGSHPLKIIWRDDTTGNTSEVIETGNCSSDVGEWVHWAIYLDATDANSVVFYKNGTSVSTSVIKTAATSLGDSGATFTVGTPDGTTEFFDGLIDDIRVWSDERTQNEIENNMFETLAGNETNLEGYWELNATSTDKTSNDNDLTENGSPSYSEEPAHQIVCTLPTNFYFGSSFSLNISCNLYGLF